MSTPKSSPTQTLIVLHGNRFIEVYSSERQSVKIVNVPFVHSAQGELLIEELLELRLPPVWSKVYRDGNLIDRDAIRDIKPTDIQKRDYEVSLLRSFNRIAEVAGQAVRT